MLNLSLKVCRRYGATPGTVPYDDDLYTGTVPSYDDVTDDVCYAIEFRVTFTFAQNFPVSQRVRLTFGPGHGRSGSFISCWNIPFGIGIQLVSHYWWREIQNKCRPLEKTRLIKELTGKDNLYYKSISVAYINSFPAHR